MAMDGSTIIHDATSGAWASVWYAGKRVLVTGGTSGIGAGLARGFIEAGAHVTVAGVGDAEIAAAAADPLLSKARAHKLDVRDGDAIKSLVNSLDGLDVVVNCAGVIRRGDELEPDVFESVVDINLNGTMRVCSAARAALGKDQWRDRQSRLHAVVFRRRSCTRLRRKQGGIAQLTKSLAIAYAGDGIRVNAIAPGWIATPLTSHAGRSRTQPAHSQSHTARTLGHAIRSAWRRSLSLLAAASFVTGTVLVIDGGYAIA
jgi:NAD(P)-dependent dehydrogenase (short-subunit alcohol dehydrogenase family)